MRGRIADKHVFFGSVLQLGAAAHDEPCLVCVSVPRPAPGPARAERTPETQPCRRECFPTEQAQLDARAQSTAEVRYRVFCVFFYRTMQYPSKVRVFIYVHAYMLMRDVTRILCVCVYIYISS